MKLNAYCIYDEKAEAYNTPFFFNHDGQATRAFMDQAINQESMICQHPGDFKLYRVGSFDSESGKLEDDNKQPVFLMSGSQIKAEGKE